MMQQSPGGASQDFSSWRPYPETHLSTYLSIYLCILSLHSRDSHNAVRPPATSQQFLENNLGTWARWAESWAHRRYLLSSKKTINFGLLWRSPIGWHICASLFSPSFLNGLDPQEYQSCGLSQKAAVLLVFICPKSMTGRAPGFDVDPHDLA